MTLSAGACDMCDGDTPTVGQSIRITADESISSPFATVGSCTDADNNGDGEELLITCLLSKSFSMLSSGTAQTRRTNLFE